MDESLKTAAEIRRELEGRHHSDSTGQMLCDFDEILSAALSLPPGARAMLADHLLVNLDSPNQEQIDALGHQRLRDEYAKSTKAKLRR